MANLPEANAYTAGIYQIEQDDSVVGGPNGVANRQAKQLADRTNYLKRKADSAEAKDEAHDASITDLRGRVETIETDGTGEDTTPVRDYWWR